MAEKPGGRLLSAYVTTGQYVVLTFDLPDGQAMIKIAAAISVSGNARTRSSFELTLLRSPAAA
jgi:uncharacterized protein with GYD domain